jgi:hypothetical protein
VGKVCSKVVNYSWKVHEKYVEKMQDALKSFIDEPVKSSLEVCKQFVVSCSKLEKASQ